MAAKKKSSSKVTRKKAAPAAGSAVAADAPSLTLEPTPKNLEQTLVDLEEVVARLPKPAAPTRAELVDVLVHAHFVPGHACGLGQEVLRRIEENFVDRNEFRIAEAYEIAAVLDDLPIDGLFERCRALHDAVQQIYNDQNSVNLDHLREGSVTERKAFFQRIPAIGDEVAQFVGRFIDWEEVCFSERSTQRVQARLGLDAKGDGKNEALEKFVARVRELLAPFGHLPLGVGTPLPSGRARTDPPLSPACLLLRLQSKSR
ncbi:MAG: hypothetical protein IPM29_16130 [Planctomycetes bacterium]|nr:hypothetical protein [Planctomycetota bacterium]